ncbi:MAG: hypothetical protein ACP5FL_04815 [Thermoplasmatota archaeon]
MEYTVLKKGLAVATIALFFGLAVFPAGGLMDSSAPGETATHAASTAPVDAGQETLTIAVDEYQPDGTIITRQVVCAREDVEQMTLELDRASGIEEIVSILASHGIISRHEAQELVAAIREHMDTAEPDMVNLWLPPLSVMFFSEVSTTFRWGGTIRLGMTPFLRLINRFLKSNLQRGFDVVDLCWGLRGTLYTRGLLGEHRLTLRPGMVCLAGFIGYGIHIPLLRHSFYGSAMMTLAAGLGEHDFDPWFPN